MLSDDAAAKPCFSKFVEATLLRDSCPIGLEWTIDRTEIVSCRLGLSGAVRRPYRKRKKTQPIINPSLVK